MTQAAAKTPAQPTLYAVNNRNPKVRFRVVNYDPKTKIGVLEGEYGAQFTRNLGKDSLTKFGYHIVKEA